MPGGDGREAHGDTCKHQPSEECKGYGEQCKGQGDYAENGEYRQHDHDIDHAPGGTPEQFPRDHVLDRERCRDHGIKTFLVIHPDKRSVRAFKECRIHDGNGEYCRGDEGHVRDTLNLLDIRPDAHADGKQVEECLDKRGEKIDLPCPDEDGQVPVPYFYGTPAHRGD